ncbi:MAG TPA: response regulator [Anaerolineales bacterium]|nr:response regulator [Anaerolineales bacterium]
MADGEKFRVLIVDDIAETRENIRKLLQFEADIEVAAVARTGREAIQLTQEVNPDVVLMDINMPDMDGIAATEIIRQKMPAVQVVVLSVQGDQNYMRKAMLVGARDFLTKPPMPDELVAAIRRAGKMAREERMKTAQSYVAAPSGSNFTSAPGAAVHGKVIMFYSPKGGTGCTTLAVNAAVALCNEETRVVIVDANLQFGDVALFLNEQGKNTVLDLTPRAEELDPSIVDDVMIKHAGSGLQILASPSRPEHGEKVNPEQFTKLLQYLRQLYAYIIVDTSTYLNDVTLSVLDVAEAVVLVTVQDIPSIKNDRLFLDLLMTLNIPPEKVVLVMNKYDKRITILPEKIGENLKQPVEAVIPRDDNTVIPSVNRGVPFMLDNKTQPAARGVYTLVEALRARLVKQEAVEPEKTIRR